MNDYITILISGGVAGGVAYIFLKYLAKKIFEQTLSKELLRYEAQLNKKADVLKTNLSLYVNEQNVVLNRLDNQKAEAVKDVHLAICKWAWPVRNLLRFHPDNLARRLKMQKIVPVAILWFVASLANAQSGFAPDHIRGTEVISIITDGSGIFAKIGIGKTIISETGNRYQSFALVGDIGEEAGTYTYTKTGPNSASLVSFDDLVGPIFGAFTTFLVFTSPTSGLWSISNEFGSQSGQFEFIIQLPVEPIFEGIPIGDFPGWRASPWYLNYNIDFWPWIFHDEHGWQFVAANSTSEVIFAWDLGLSEWLFLNKNTYRWLYLFGESSGWIWAFGDSPPNTRVFQRSDDGSIFSIPAGS